MKTADCHRSIAFFFLVFMIGVVDGFSQNRSVRAVIADFSIPDTVCSKGSIPIVNLSQGATTWLWKFCTGDPLTDIHGIALGNPSNSLDNPLGITLVQDGGIYYAFITNSTSGTVTQVTWTNGLMKPPAAVNLGNFGILVPGVFGIQVEHENGNWYGFVTNGSSLVRLDFGTSLSAGVQNALTVASAPSMLNARGLVIEQDGTQWVGFCTSYPNANITRFFWNDVLTSTITVDALGNIGGLTEPMQPALIRDVTGWYMFIANTTSLTQLTFGNSLLTTPTSLNLGNLGWMTDDRGMSLFVECNIPYGLITNHNLVANLLLQLHFTDGIAGTKSITPLGSVANLYEPLALSETVNLGDTIFTIATNATPSLTTLYFPPCTNSPIPPIYAFDPNPVVLTNYGTYTVTLTVDEGLPTEQSVCKVFVIEAPLSISLGNDTSVCEGTTLILDPGSGYQHYIWNTGDTSQTIVANQSGDYSVQVTNRRGCQAADTIHVDVVKQINTTIDTSICFGQKYMASGHQQTNSGTYIDSLVIQGGCYHIITTNLEVRPEVMVNIGADTCLDSGDTIALQANVTGSSSTTWQDGTQDTVFRVIKPGNYWVTVVVNTCVGSDPIHGKSCPGVLRFFFPTALTPNGDGLNDEFKPKGSEMVDFHMLIYDRWGQLVFESRDPATGWNGRHKGEYCPPGVYTFIATYASAANPGEVTETTGTFTLLK